MHLLVFLIPPNCASLAGLVLRADNGLVGIWLFFLHFCWYDGHVYLCTMELFLVGNLEASLDDAHNFPITNTADNHQQFQIYYQSILV